MQLHDAAEGLLYLHSRSTPIVHGDLKCVRSFFSLYTHSLFFFENITALQANILVHDNGTACLAGMCHSLLEA